MTTMTSIRVAAVQAELVWFSAADTVDKTIGLIAEAAAAGADLIAFPETWLPGYPIFLWTHPVIEQIPFVMQYRTNSVTPNGPELTAIRMAAREHGITVVLGYSERDAGSLYMAQSVFGPDGDAILHRRKLKPTHVERTLFGESDGSGIRVVETALGRLGALNCWEHLQPLVKYAMYAQDEQIHVAGWPCFGFLKQATAFTAEVNMAATQTYAVEGGVFAVAATQILAPENVSLFQHADGSPSPIVQGGGGFARVYGPDGGLLTTPLDEFTEGLVIADIDLNMIGAAKNAADPAGHYARPDVTQLLFDSRPRPAVLVTSGEPAPAPYVPLADLVDEPAGV